MLRRSSLLDWLYPPACVACRVLLPVNEKNGQRPFCPACRELFTPITKERSIATFTYEGLIRELILDMKFNSKKQIAQALGLLWAECLQSYPVENISDYVLVPVPMHRNKKRRRGFNQAEVMSLPLAARLNIPIANVLSRTRDTTPQSEVHFSRRAENVRGAFCISPRQEPRGRNYILTDDIFTTGASLNECTRVLKNAGAASVICMTLTISVKTT